MIPKVLVGYHARPMCVGLFYRDAFRQAGCQVRTIGPSSNEVYGFAEWPDDYVPNDFASDGVIDVNAVVQIARNAGFNPDVAVMIDQYDFAYWVGASDGSIKTAWVAVENFNAEQRGRADQRCFDAEFYMIRHDQHGTQPSPPVAIDSAGRPAEWMVFGADISIHPHLNLERDKWVCQIGSTYDPRPATWNELARRIDGDAAGPDWSAAQYSRSLRESPRTIFGKVPSYRSMAVAYNRALCALSWSGVSFIPMRCVEAFAMGCVLISDDVQPIRDAFGAPFNEDQGNGYWLAHQGSAASMYDNIKYVAENPDAYRLITTRALASALREHLYVHEARRILAAVGLEGAVRMVTT